LVSWQNFANRFVAKIERSLDLKSCTSPDSKFRPYQITIK
jgi:hypothetical protein